MILMSTKLKMPQPRNGYIVREELFSKLEKINEYKVTLVKGGAGTGKTTLITTFVKENKILNLKWISIDDSCNNVFIFWNYFIEAVGEYLGNAKQDFLSMQDSNFQKENMKKIITLLINNLDENEDIYIVFDDFYYITEEFLLHTIDFFIKNTSDNIHIIIITRHEPTLYLGSLNMEGKLLIIDDNDFKLSSKEGFKFLTQTLRLSQSEENLKLINEVSEGWIGGMQLVAAAVGCKNKSEIINLNFNNRMLGEYLTKEIYEFLNEEEKKFLIVTSILSYFNEEICSKLLENIQYKKMIEGLIEKNILIICIDEENGIYRYHNILKEYLIGKFKELEKEEQWNLHFNAAKILEELGDNNEALEQLIVSKGYNEAMELIIDESNNVSMFSYIDRIPIRFIIKNPDFAYQSFFYYYVNMEFEKCMELYNLIKEYIDKDILYSAFKFSNMFIEDTFNINYINVMTRSEIDSLLLKDITKAIILIKDSTYLYVQSKFKDALEYIDKAIWYAKNKEKFYLEFFSLSNKSQILEELGEFNKCEEIYKEMEKIKGLSRKLFILSASFDIGITGIHLKRMDVKSAEKSLKNVEECISKDVLSLNRGYKYNLAEYKFIIGEAENAVNLVNEIINDENQNNLVYLARLLKYYFKENKYSGKYILEFMTGYESLAQENRTLESKFLYANILGSKNNFEEAIIMADEILTCSRKNNIKLKIVEVALFKIRMLFIMKENNREIINLFKEAIFYSYEDKILQPFYVESNIVAKVIKDSNSEIYSCLSSSEKIYYKEIMGLCNINSKSVLSQREIEVLNEIARGSSNKEIAEVLCISLATVKSHIINIYSKLQVNNRISAIEAAKGNDY